jgi:CRP-like cAMP-binding protein
VSTQSIRDLLARHEFFLGLDSDHLDLIAGCGTNEHYEPGAFILREGEAANHFYVLRTGAVMIEIHAAPRGALAVETLGPGDVLGWSWLVPPWRWHFDARVVEPTSAIALDGACLRRKCDADPKLGYELMKRFVGVIMERLQATRLQLLDVYGPARA